MYRRLLIVGLVVITLAGVGIVSSPTATAAPDSFEGPTLFDGGFFQNVVATGDMNGDGNVDMVLPQFGLGTVVVLFGDGAGDFPTSFTSANFGTTPWSVALGDYDDDEDLDIAVATDGGGDLQIFVLVNDGAGSFTFGAPEGAFSASIPGGLATADFDEDGVLDLVVANEQADSISFLFGLGGGDFDDGSVVTFGAGDRPWSIAVGDVDGDDNTDVVVTNLISHDLRVFLGDGSGGFIGPVDVDLDPFCGPRSVTLADFDDNGDDDIAVACSGTGNVNVLLSDGGVLAESAELDAEEGPNAVASGDFDGDGAPDLAVATAGFDGVYAFLGVGDGSFTELDESPFASGGPDAQVNTQGVGGLASADLTNDGVDDLAAASEDAVAVFLSTFTAPEPEPEPEPEPGGGGGSSSRRRDAPVVIRSGGNQRYDTAAMSNADLDPGVEVAYVTTGENFPDALATGPVAGIEGAALLLVGREEIPAETAAELERLAPGRIVVVGGIAAVSDAVKEELQAYARPVTRIAGVDRYGTALELSADAFPDGAPIVYLASGTGFAEAVASGPAAGLEGGPVLLVRGHHLGDDVAAELQRLGPSTIVIAGGVGSVPSGIEEDVRALVGPGITVTRAGAFSRYSTGAALARRVLDASSDTIFVSTGEVFADGLASTPWAIRRGAPILLVPSDGQLPFTVIDVLNEHPTADVIVIGGTAAVSDSIFDALEVTRSNA